MVRQLSRHHLAFFWASLAAVAACGRFEPREEHRNLRSSDQEVSASASDSEPEQGSRANSAENPEAPRPQLVFDTAQVPQFDRRSSHLSEGSYFQRDKALVDLFSDAEATKGESLLCWPAAMAFQLNYQSQRPPFARLAKNMSDLRASSTADQVRWFADYCGFDKNRGTNVPEAVRCLTKFYTAQRHRSAISVVGVDAQWASFGLFPESTATNERGIRASDVMDALDRDSSVVMLLGFYERDGTTGKMVRRTGHFASITGYDYRTIWSEQELQLHVVNPAVDYLERADESKFDRIHMRLIPKDSDLRKIPEAVTYTLEGQGVNFSGYTAVLESLISFSAKPD